MNMKVSDYNFFNPRTWAISKVINDLRNYREWVKTINKEKANPNSMWNRLKMNHNYFYTVYFPLVLSEEYRELPDNIKKLRVIESLSPVHRYFDDDLGFAEYIVPEFNQFYDDQDNPTLVYGIVYRFVFKRLSFKWFISRLLLLVLLGIAAFNHKPIVQWMLSLI